MLRKLRATINEKTFDSTVILSHNLTGQDFVFFDYSNLRTNLNPAFAGNGCGQRLSLYYQFNRISRISSYRYRTFGLNFDMPIALSEKYHLGLGYQSTNSFYGRAIGLMSNLVAISLHRKFRTNIMVHAISGAIEGGIHRRTIDTKRSRWPNQLEVAGYNPTLPNNGLIPDFTVHYGDINLGLNWSTEFAKK